MKCLDFSELGAAKVEEQGADYVDKLNAILTWLSSEATDNPQRFDRETLEQEPGRDLKAQTLGHSPALITLVQRADGPWDFAASSVREIPEIGGKLGQLDETPRLDTDSPQANRLLSLPKATATDSFRRGTGRTDRCRRRRGDCRR